MKRILIAFSIILLSLTAAAKEPSMALVKLFDGRYNDNPRVEWSKVKRSGKTSYYLDFNNNDKNIIKEVMNALEKDMNGEEFETEIITKSEKYYKAVIQRNGHKIEVGFSIPRNGKCSLYIRGDNKAFE